LKKPEKAEISCLQDSFRAAIRFIRGLALIFLCPVPGFLPAFPGESMQTVKIYTTGTCPYCIQAKQLLKERGVTELDEIRVDMVPGERQKMMEITGRRSVPQIFIGATHVGGCDDLVALDGRSGLMPLLNA
jgi:glutaredoxin 3